MLFRKFYLGLALAFVVQLVQPSWANPPVKVTGYPASRAYLKTVLEQHGWTNFPDHQLQPGDVWTTPDHQQVINIDWKAPPASLAALSDHPEEVHERGSLFSGGLTALRPIRLQYYHLGALDGPSPELQLWMSNPSPRPARVHLMRAAGTPSQDYFAAGHSNNVHWFHTRMRGEGEFFELAPGESVIAYTQPFPLNAVVSGTLKLTLVEGSPVTFDLIASPDGTPQLALNNLLKEGDVHSRGFYPIATQVFQREHTVGNPETRIAVGALRQETFAGVRELRGDYGVLYDIDLKLTNPSAHQAQVDILFNPRGGTATGSFWCEGKVLEVPMTPARQEKLITTVTLAPHSRRTLSMKTIPEGASSYPIRLLVRDRQTPKSSAPKPTP